MNFYTNITRWGNNLLLREVVNGQRINQKIKYCPKLYSKAQILISFNAVILASSNETLFCVLSFIPRSDVEKLISCF